MVCRREVSGNAKAAPGALSQDLQPAEKRKTASAFARRTWSFEIVPAREKRTFLRAVIRSKDDSAALKL